MASSIEEFEISYLPYTDALKLGLVCKKYRRAIKGEYFWKFQHVINGPEFIALRKYSKYMTTLHLHYHYIDYAKYCDIKYKNLRIARSNFFIPTLSLAKIALISCLLLILRPNLIKLLFILIADVLYAFSRLTRDIPVLYSSYKDSQKESGLKCLF